MKFTPGWRTTAKSDFTLGGPVVISCENVPSAAAGSVRIVAGSPTRPPGSISTETVLSLNAMALTGAPNWKNKSPLLHPAG